MGAQKSHFTGSLNYTPYLRLQRQESFKDMPAKLGGHNLPPFSLNMFDWAIKVVIGIENSEKD